jgi:hypothetical protein
MIDYKPLIRGQLKLQEEKCKQIALRYKWFRFSGLRSNGQIGQINSANKEKEPVTDLKLIRGSFLEVSEGGGFFD